MNLDFHIILTELSQSPVDLDDSEICKYYEIIKILRFTIFKAHILLKLPVLVGRPETFRLYGVFHVTIIHRSSKERSY